MNLFSCSLGTLSEGELPVKSLIQLLPKCCHLCIFKKMLSTVHQRITGPSNQMKNSCCENTASAHKTLFSIAIKDNKMLSNRVDMLEKQSQDHKPQTDWRARGIVWRDGCFKTWTKEILVLFAVVDFIW